MTSRVQYPRCIFFPLLLLLLLVVAVERGEALFQCGQVTTSSIAPLDPRFSPNACIIINDFTAVDCDRVRDLFVDSSLNATLDPCPGYTATLEPAQINGTQIIYSQVEDAVKNCPFNPVLIEFIGTVYMTNISNFTYDKPYDLIIRGISQVTVVPPANITGLVPVSITYYNTTLNQTVTETVLQEQVIGMTPEQTYTLQSTIVGFQNLQVIAQNITVTFDDWLNEGCGTTNGVFLTKACDSECGEDPTHYCAGAWFRKSDDVTDNSVCQQTGAYFDGFSTLYVLPTADTPIGDVSAQEFNYDEFTLELWFNPSFSIYPAHTGVAGNYARTNQKTGDTGYGFVILTPLDRKKTNLMTWHVSQPGRRKNDIECSYPIAENTWTHFAGTFNRNYGIALYVDGFIVCNKTITTRNPNAVPDYYRTRPFRIGGSPINAGSNDETLVKFTGILDEVRLWNYQRTSAQIQFAYQSPIDPNSAGLMLYYPFDQGSSTPFANVAPATTTPTWTRIKQTNSDANLTLIYDCFCLTLEASCTPSRLYFTEPLTAVDFIYSDNNLTNYEFVYSAIFSPNGDYGLFWAPGIEITTGPIFNQTTHFIPGRFTDLPNTPMDIECNTINNVTVNRTFIPGINPTNLSPVLSALWKTYPPLPSNDFFMQGVFLNNGQPPFWAGNFFPGRFRYAEVGDTLPACYQGPCTKIFEPGIFYPDGSSLIYLPPNPHYVIPMTFEGGLCWNDTITGDECTIRPLTVLPATTTPIDDLETYYNCNISMSDVEPLFLNRAQRTPCFALRDIRLALNGATSVNVSSCNFSSTDIEPTYLDPRQRHPCFVARDIQAITPNASSLVCDDGTVPLPPVYMPCLKNQNLTMTNMVVQNFYGEKVVCQYACEENVNSVIMNSAFKYTPGNALWLSGMNNYDVHGNLFCPCGGMTDSCVYLNGNHISIGEFLLYNNRHCAIEDLLPYTCNYPLTTELQCVNGALQCLDIAATLDINCQQVEVAPGVFYFDSDCAVYAPCQCSQEQQNVTLPDGTIITLDQNTGSFSIDIDFLTPLISDITGGQTSMNLSCTTTTVNQSFVYTCYENVTTSVTINNVTTNFTILVAMNCTYYQEIAVGSLNPLSCACPQGFNASQTTNLTGSAATGALGLYSTCNWLIPNGQPGEVCLNGVVQCPYLGGTLGSGEPPPVPVGSCDNGVATLSCADCVGGTQYYEGKTYTCDCATDNYFTVACECEDFALTVTCSRGVSCIDTLNTCNGTQCAYSGDLTFDNVVYPCFVEENQTLCIGFTYVVSQPTPADGFVTLPCDNSYVLPGPGPCSCSQPTTTSSNITVACNTTVDPNCTSSTPTIVDPSLQLTCQPSGQITCRCDGAQAIGAAGYANFTLNNQSAAFWIDHVQNEASLWFQQINVAQQLAYGWRYTRFAYDLISNFPLRVLGFYSDMAIMYESSKLSPFITGTVADWADGYNDQWNFRSCNMLDPGPEVGVLTNECKQYRPPENSSCVVDSTYRARITDGYFITRFNRINDALDEGCDVIIVHKGTNAYEERMIITRSNIWIGSYDNAIIVAAGHGIYDDQITFRGLTLQHTNAISFPLIQAKPVSNNNFDTDFSDAPDGATTPKNFRILNCVLFGNNVDKAGAIIGTFGESFTLLFSTIQSFKTRAIYITSEFVEVRLNTFIECRGRAFRIALGYSYIFDENLLINPTGSTKPKRLEIVSFEAQGDLGPIIKQNIGTLIFQNFSAAEYINAFDISASIAAINPNVPAPLGCNSYLFPDAQCYVRGNIITFVDEAGQPDYSTICYRFIGGNITADRIHHNKCTHGQIGMDFTSTPSINYLNADEISATNALIRVQDSYQGDDISTSADFCFRSPGSLVSVCCFYPNCWPNTTFPTMEVNPRCDFDIVPRFGFDCMQNLTDASRFNYPLDMLNVTSNQALLRREVFSQVYDLYAAGYRDKFCCARPIIYGAGHQIATPTAVYQYLEFRFSMNLTALGDQTLKLFETPSQYYAENMQFIDVNFDGRYTIGTGKVRIASVHIEPTIGKFVLMDSRIYNWWHLPLDSRRGIITSNKGVVPIIVLPSDDTFFYTIKAPTIEGFYVYFQNSDFITTSQYVPGSKQAPFKQIQSTAVITNNVFRDLDGNVLSIIQPGNWQIEDNVVLDCGMRQFMAVSCIYLQGNMRSLGEYFFENNYLNTTKPYLFPKGGGSANNERFSGISVTGMLYPNVFIFRNITVVRNGPTRTYPFITQTDTQEDKTVPGVKYGWFEQGGPKILNAPYQVMQTPKPNTWNAYDIADTDTRPGRIIASTNADINALENPASNSFSDPDQQLLSLVSEGKIYVKDIVDNTTGYTAAVRFKLPPQVLIMTLNPRTPNTTYFSFAADQLYPYRIISVESGFDAAYILSWGNVSRPPDNGPGLHGINADIISCQGYQDALQENLNQCVVCNSGCPIPLPTECRVDPQNATFVPENPYYNSWLFSSLQTAMLRCRSGTRKIVVVKQDRPYTEAWTFNQNDWTIISYDQAEVFVSSSVTIANNNIHLQGFVFLHAAGSYAPTLTSSSLILGTSPSNITVVGCTFRGANVEQSAILGSFQRLALRNNRFSEYGPITASVVYLSSQCGMLFMENNTFADVPASAVTATSYNVLVFHRNKFRKCGAEAPNSMPYCVYLQSCYDTSTRIIFTENKHHERDYVHQAGHARIAAYWLDTLPFYRSAKTRVPKIDLTSNIADGLDIGLRVTNVDDLGNNANTYNQVTVAYLTTQQRNQDVHGDWYYIVWGAPVNDAQIEADPEATKQHHCSNDCSTSAKADVYFAIFWGTVFGVVVAIILFICCCQLASPREATVVNTAHGPVYTSLGVIPDQRPYPY